MNSKSSFIGVGEGIKSHGLDSDAFLKLKEESKALSSTIEKTYKQSKEELAKNVQDAFDKALLDFYNDRTVIDKYKKYNVIAEHGVIVQLFEFKLGKEFSGKRALGETSIFVKSSLNQEWVEQTTDINEKVYPIVKVLKKGDDVKDSIKEGNLYSVPFSEIEGMAFNPDFLHAIQAFASSKKDGKSQHVHVPEDMPQKLRSLDIEWSRYKFKIPNSVVEQDSYIYLITDSKLKTEIPI